VRARDDFEVDFLARAPDGAEQLIQVCADVDAPDARERETRGLLSAAAEHPRATLHIVALNATATPSLPGNIRLHHAVEWLLEE
jgi:uncharacterized protein